MSLLEEVMQAALVAPDDRKAAAVKVLKGDPPVARTAAAGPLLLGMGAAAKLLGVSRSSLWRMLGRGQIPKVELFPGSFRVRREDLEALAEGGHTTKRTKGAKEGGRGSGPQIAQVGASETGHPKLDPGVTEVRSD